MVDGVGKVRRFAGRPMRFSVAVFAGCWPERVEIQPIQ